MSPFWHDPVLSCDEARTLEGRLFGGNEDWEWTAMQRAGAAVARAVLDDYDEIGGFPANGRVLVLAGKGHNAGDALLAARTILERHPNARAWVWFAFGERALRPLAWRAWRGLLHGTGGRVGRISEAAAALDPAGCELCLDGIFGFQFRPPVDPATSETLRRVNAHPGIRLRAAVDLPSGLAGERGGIAFHADFTYATGSVKAPALAGAGRETVGRLRYLDLGFFDPLAAHAKAPGKSRDVVLKPLVLSALAALRRPQSDKRSFGHLFVVGGSRAYPGAVLMCVRSALRSGVGLVTAFVPKSLVPSYAAQAPEAIWVGWPETPDGHLAPAGLRLLEARLDRARAIVLGPGLGNGRAVLKLAGDLVRMVRTPLVLDADALQATVVKAGRDRTLVCLPHAGEFERLSGGREASPASLRAVARETGATIVLKGPVTRIADGDRLYHSLYGGPVLARGGSGDLLAGLVGGLLAQGPEAPVAAACCGVLWHGFAADLLARTRGQVAVEVTQLHDYLSPALRHPVVEGPV